MRPPEVHTARLNSPGGYPAPEPPGAWAGHAQAQAPSAPVSYGGLPGFPGHNVAPPDPQASLAATVQSAAPVPVASIPSPTEHAASPTQAPLPGVEPGGARFPSTITIRLPRVRREYVVAVASVVATLAAVALFFVATRPAENHAHGEPLDGDKARTPPSGTAVVAATLPAASTSATVVPSPAAPATSVTPVAVATSAPATAPPAPTTFSIGALPTATPSPTVGGPLPATPTPSPRPTEEKPAPAAGGGGTGTISVVCRPACDAVYVRARNMGPSPLIGLALPAGSYPVTLKRSGSPNKQTILTVIEGKNTPLRVDM